MAVPYGFSPWSEIVDALNPLVPGCPAYTIREAVQRVTRDVCTRTHVYRHMQPLLRLVPGEYEYAYDVPPKTEIVAVQAARLIVENRQDPSGEPTNQPLHPATVEQAMQGELSGVGAGWPDTQDRSRPQYYMSFNPGALMVAPTPDDAAVYDVRMSVSLQPTTDAEYMASAILDRVRESVVDGVLQHLYAQSGQPWGSHRLRDWHARQYTFKVNRLAGSRGLARTVPFVAQRPFR